MEKTLTNTKNTIASEFYSFVIEEELSNINVSCLMKRCGFSRQTFYRHYLDIYDVIYYIFEQNAISPVHQNIFQRDCEFYINSFEYCLENIRQARVYYSKIINIQEYNFIEEDLYQYFVDCTMEYIGHNRWDSDLETMTSIYYSGVAKEIFNWIKRGYDKDTETFAHLIYDAMPEKMKNFY